MQTTWHQYQNFIIFLYFKDPRKTTSTWSATWTNQNETILKYNIDVNACLSPIFLTGGCVLFLVTVHVISLYWPKAGVCVKNSEMSASSLLLGQTTRSYLFHAILTWTVACASLERSELGKLIPITTLQWTRQHRRLLKRTLNFILPKVKTRVFFSASNVLEKFFVISFYWPEIKALDKINVISVQYGNDPQNRPQ